MIEATRIFTSRRDRSDRRSLAEALALPIPFPLTGREPFASLARLLGLAARPLDGRPHPFGYGGLPKRMLDVALVLLSAPFVLPVVGILMLLAAHDGHSPIYRQRRIGRDGRPYDMLKIRTMVPDADRLLARHLDQNPEARAEWDKHQKLRDDPRITGFGALLRKTSLDELPQLWNVLKGDMSLVGPRPMMPDQQPLYPGRSYYDLRPGLTGSWQVSDRNASSFADRAIFDDDYRARLTPLTDLVILVKTVSVVLRGTGC